MCKSIGCMGNCMAFLLAVINFLLFLVGAAFFISTCSFKWGYESYVKKFSGHEIIQAYIVFDETLLALLITSGLVVVLSLIGLFGALCGNKFFLISQQVLLVILFLGHIIGIVLFALSAHNVEGDFRVSLDKTVIDITQLEPDSKEYMTKCSGFKVLSRIFKCCGSNSTSDFKLDDKQIKHVCCHSDYDIGCSDKIINMIKENALHGVVVPNISILAFEFVLILMISFIVGKINDYNDMKNLMRFAYRPSVVYGRPSAYDMPQMAPMSPMTPRQQKRKINI